MQRGIEVIQDLVDQQGEPFPMEIQNLILGTKWRAAKSEWWPHEYIIREWIEHNNDLNEAFNMAFNHIQEHGYKGRWFRTERRYFLHTDGWVYFFCQPRVYKGKPPRWITAEEETILNRVTVELSFDYRDRMKTARSKPKSGNLELF